VDDKKQQFSPPGEKDLKRPPRFQLPDPVTLGVESSNFPSIGKKVKRIPSPDRQTEYKFKGVLAYYGFDWGGVAPDHVQDLAWSGDDSFNNLWPLDSGKNTAANDVYTQEVTYAKKGTKTAIKANPNSPDLSGKWFKISSIRS
jgi:hypothetical protein